MISKADHIRYVTTADGTITPGEILTFRVPLVPPVPPLLWDGTDYFLYLCNASAHNTDTYDS